MTPSLGHSKARVPPSETTQQNTDGVPPLVLGTFKGCPRNLGLGLDPSGGLPVRYTPVSFQCAQLLRARTKSRSPSTEAW